MKCLPVSDEAISEALEMLSRGGVIAHATETCYGLACDLTNPDAVAKVFEIKHRPTDKPLSALFESDTQAAKYTEWNDRAQEMSQKHLPGPLTLILPIGSDAPKKLYPSPKGGETLGVRISSHSLAQKIVETFEKPLSTTSANIHGKPNPYSAEDIVKQFENEPFQPDLILDSGILPPSPPSTVINLTEETPETLRKGAIDSE